MLTRMLIVARIGVVWDCRRVVLILHFSDGAITVGRFRSLSRLPGRHVSCKGGVLIDISRTDLYILR